MRAGIVSGENGALVLRAAPTRAVPASGLRCRSVRYVSRPLSFVSIHCRSRCTRRRRRPTMRVGASHCVVTLQRHPSPISCAPSSALLTCARSTQVDKAHDLLTPNPRPTRRWLSRQNALIDDWASHNIGAASSPSRHKGPYASSVEAVDFGFSGSNPLPFAVI